LKGQRSRNLSVGVLNLPMNHVFISTSAWKSKSIDGQGA
jgi:hypothetical protein